MQIYVLRKKLLVLEYRDAISLIHIHTYVSNLQYHVSLIKKEFDLRRIIYFLSEGAKMPFIGILRRI